MIIERVEFEIAPGQEEAFLAHCDAHRDTFAAMAGCNSFRFGRGVENPSKMMLLLHWDSVDAHNAAREAGAIKPFGAALGPMLAGTPSMEHFDLAE
jgi:quinol monooxygenase YgiN